MKKFIQTLLNIAAIFGIYQVILRLLRRYAKFPAPAFIGRILDSDWRRRLQPPWQVILRSGIEPGMQVLEIGCGSGGFTTYVARAVGPQGRVYALDIQPEMLAQLSAKLNRPENSSLNNIELINQSAYSLPFPDETLDLVYMVTVFQEIPDRLRVLNEVRRVLKPGAFLAISELLVDPDYPWISTTARWGLKAGFVVDRIEGNVWTYTVRFKKEVLAPAD
ncbi:MAG TPA: methyltransferase domain-containing protein [Anaerolinea sp.]|nr:methyltransferase domain-containing protein [Anaerolinea sp.]